MNKFIIYIPLLLLITISWKALADITSDAPVPYDSKAVPAEIQKNITPEPIAPDNDLKSQKDEGDTTQETIDKANTKTNPEKNYKDSKPTTLDKCKSVIE